MANVIINDTNLINIADAIRGKNGTTDTYKPSEMADAITNLPSGGGSGDLSEYIETTVTSSISQKFGPQYMIKKIPALTIDESVTNMNSFFKEMRNLEEIGMTSIDTKNVTDMSYMFQYTKKLKNIPQIDTSNVTNMEYMFESAAVASIPNFDFSKVTSANYMFSSCTSLTGAVALTLPEATSVSSMFYSTGITEAMLDAPKGLYMNGIFRNSRSLTKATILNSSNATNMGEMFSGCTSLESINVIDTSNVTNMSNMFYNCNSLKTIPKLIASKVTQINNVVTGFYNLQNLGGFENLGQGYLTSRAANYSAYTLSLSNQNQLTYESLMNVINNLYDIKTAGCKAQKLVLGSTNMAKLTSDEIAIATNKGWTVS